MQPEVLRKSKLKMDLEIKTFVHINLLLSFMGLVPVITASKPQMLKISGPDEVVAGESSLFTCSAICNPPCFYTWYMEDQTVNGSTLSLTANGLSSFESVTCSVTNDYKNFVAENKFIRVINPYSVRPVPNKSPKVRQPYNLTCDGASPPATIIWLKDDDLLRLDSRMSLSSDNTTLMFSILEKTDSGKYQCKVFKGSVGVLSVNFQIEFGYVIINLSGPNRVEVGLQSEFTCGATCGMDCTVNWSLQSVIPKGRFIADGPKILWTPSDVGQTQIFICIALNSSAGKLGQVTKKVTVVEAQPHPRHSDAASVKPSVAAVSSAALLILVSAYI